MAEQDIQQATEQAKGALHFAAHSDLACFTNWVGNAKQIKTVQL